MATLQRQPPSYEESQRDLEAGLLEGPIPTPFPSLSQLDRQNAASGSSARVRKQSRVPAATTLRPNNGQSGRTLSSPSATPSFLSQRPHVGIYFGSAEVMSTEDLPTYSDPTLVKTAATERTALLEKSDRSAGGGCMKRSRNRAPTMMEYTVDQLIRREFLEGNEASARNLKRIFKEEGEAKGRAAAALLHKDRLLDVELNTMGF